MRFFKWLFGSDGHDHDHEYGEYRMGNYFGRRDQSPRVLNEISKRIKKSRQWTAEDIQEILDILLINNDYLFKLYGKNGNLEQENWNLKSKITELEKKIHSIEQSLLILNKPQKVRQEVADWLDLLSRCRKAYESVLTRLSVSRKKFQQQYDETIGRQLNAISEAHDYLHRNDINHEYLKLYNEIEGFVPTFRSFGIHMCMAVEKDALMVNSKLAKDEDDAIKKLLSVITVEMIEPLVGENFKNTEHEKVDEKKGQPKDKGKIVQVLQRGCKDKGSGSVFYKARVIVSR
jgi:hypothetical protein